MNLLQHQPSLDLGGEWSFAYSLEPPTAPFHSAAELERAGPKSYRCTVPGNFELDVQAAGIIGEPFYSMNIAALKPLEHAHIWYWRRFQAEGRPGTNAELVIELFRSSKWRRTGLIWWNLIDGWPQFSDAVVDYYFQRKLAYSFIKRAQAPLYLLLKEPENWRLTLVACSDGREDIPLEYSVRDVDTGEVLISGQAIAVADSVTTLGHLPFSMGEKRFYLIGWQSALGSGRSHYLAGNPPLELVRYRDWLEKAGFLSREWIEEGGF